MVTCAQNQEIRPGIAGQIELENVNKQIEIASADGSFLRVNRETG